LWQYWGLNSGPHTSLSLSLLLEIRPLKTTRVTIEDTEAENCLKKAKFISAKECMGTWAQHTQE
jgi:hypothetical protein